PRDRSRRSALGGRRRGRALAADVVVASQARRLSHALARSGTVPQPQRWSGPGSVALADVLQQVGEPVDGGVEGAAAGDAVELDDPQLVAALLVLTDDA